MPAEQQIFSRSRLFPNDDELKLLSMMEMGWCMKAEYYGKLGDKNLMTEAEKKIIAEVIKRADELEKEEQERIGRLVYRLENLKKNAASSRPNRCAICDTKFILIFSNRVHCHDCCKSVCLECGVYVASGNKSTIFLCNVCSVTREMWKKSGAWFYRGLPKYTLPSRTNSPLYNNYRRYNPTDMNEDKYSSHVSLQLSKELNKAETRVIESETVSSEISCHSMLKIPVSTSNKEYTCDDDDLCEKQISSSNSSRLCSRNADQVPQILINNNNYCDTNLKSSSEFSDSQLVSNKHAKSNISEKKNLTINSNKSGSEKHGHKSISKSILQSKFISNWFRVRTRTAKDKRN